MNEEKKLTEKELNTFQVKKIGSTTINELSNWINTGLGIELNNNEKISVVNGFFTQLDKLMQPTKNSSGKVFTLGAVKKALANCVINGYNPQLQDCYLVPYKNNATNEEEIEIQASYKGLLKDMKYYSDNQITDIRVFTKYSNDTWKTNYLTGEIQEYVPWHEKGTDKGNLLGVYVFALVNGKQHIIFADSDYINKVKSKAKTTYVWNDWYEAMCHKTAIRKAFRELRFYIDKKFGGSGIIKADNLEYYNQANETFIGSNEIDTTYQPQAPKLINFEYDNDIVNLIDANAYIHRIYHTEPKENRMLDDNGQECYVIKHFMDTIRQLTDISKTIVFFDSTVGYHRKDIFPEYKANREKIETTIKEQSLVIKEYLTALGIEWYQVDKYEADDLVATYCKNNEDKIFQIYTSDSDYMQLITKNHNVQLIKNGFKVENWTYERFRNEYGFEPIRTIDTKAIGGDTADNYKGVEGIGEKGAKDLIKQFGSIENLYQNLDQVEKDRTRQLLIKGQDNAMLCYEIATMVDNVEFEIVEPTPNLDKTNELNEFYFGGE